MSIKKTLGYFVVNDERGCFGTGMTIREAMADYFSNKRLFRI